MLFELAPDGRASSEMMRASYRHESLYLMIVEIGFDIRFQEDETS